MLTNKFGTNIFYIANQNRADFRLDYIQAPYISCMY